MRSQHHILIEIHRIQETRREVPLPDILIDMILALINPAYEPPARDLPARRQRRPHQTLDRPGRRGRVHEVPALLLLTAGVVVPDARVVEVGHAEDAPAAVERGGQAGGDGQVGTGDVGALGGEGLGGWG